MATVVLSMNPEDGLINVVQNVGSATVYKHVELTVDQAAYITDGGSTRAINRGELVRLLKTMASAIMQEQIQPGTPNPFAP